MQVKAANATAHSTATLTPGQLNIDTPTFNVATGSNNLLSLSSSAAVVNAGSMQINSPAGLTVTGIVQAPRIQNERDRSSGLVLESIGLRAETPLLICDARMQVRTSRCPPRRA